MAADIKINLKGQSDRMQNRTLKNLIDIQNEASVGAKLLNAIKQQRSKNKYILCAVYSVLALLICYVLYQTFGFLLPSFQSSE